MRTSPFRAMSLGAKIGAYHEKYFSREGLQMLRSAKIPTMGCTLTYCSLSGPFLLAAADAPLSREIICCQKGLDLAYRKSEHPRIVLKRTASGAQLFGIGQR